MQHPWDETDSLNTIKYHCTHSLPCRTQTITELDSSQKPISVNQVPIHPPKSLSLRVSRIFIALTSKVARQTDRQPVNEWRCPTENETKTKMYFVILEHYNIIISVKAHLRGWRLMRMRGPTKWRRGEYRQFSIFSINSWNSKVNTTVEHVYLPQPNP